MTSKGKDGAVLCSWAVTVFLGKKLDSHSASLHPGKNSPKEISIYYTKLEGGTGEFWYGSSIVSVVHK